MREHNVSIHLSNGRAYLTKTFLKPDCLTEQLAYVEENIDGTSTFFTGKKGTLIPLDHIVEITFELVK